MKIFNFISDWFLKVLKTIKPILLAVFNIAFQILLEKLKDVATQSITTLASTNMTNEAKRAQAFKDISSYAKTKMLSVSDSDVNLIIEVIYKQLKNQGIIK